MTFFSVDASGLVTGLTVGMLTVTATSEGKSGSTVVVTVVSGPVANVAVTPSTATLLPGRTQRLAAITTDANSTVLAGRVVTTAYSSGAMVTRRPASSGVNSIWHDRRELSW